MFAETEMPTGETVFLIFVGGLIVILFVVVLVLLGIRINFSWKKAKLEMKQAEREADDDSDRNMHRKQDSDKSREHLWKMLDRLDKIVKEQDSRIDKQDNEREVMWVKYEEMSAKLLVCEQHHKECEADKLEALEKIADHEVRIGELKSRLEAGGI